MHHPDANSSTTERARFLEIQEAYEVLSSSGARKRYDAQCGFAEYTPEQLEEYERSYRSAKAAEPYPAPQAHRRRNSSLDILSDLGLANVSLGSLDTPQMNRILSRSAQQTSLHQHRRSRKDSFVGRLISAVCARTVRDSTKDKRSRQSTQELVEEHLRELRQSLASQRTDKDK